MSTYITSSSVCRAAVIPCHLAVGCAEMSIEPSRPPVKYPIYGIGIVNSCPGILKKVTLSWKPGGTVWYAWSGDFLPNHSAAASVQPDPIPEKTDLTWTTPDGVTHHSVVWVSSKVRDTRTFDGTIWLEVYGFGDNDLRVVPLTHAETLANAKFGRWPPLPPRQPAGSLVPATSP